MKNFVLVLLAVAACKTPAADPVPPKAQAPVTAQPAAEPPAPEKVEAPPTTPKLLVAIERTPCFGRCPIYRAEVFEDGALVFDGRRFTSVQGRREAMLTGQRLQELIARLEKSDFANWKTSYEQRGVTDMPSAFITFRDKTIRHYHGDRSAPEALTTLENDLDELLGIQPWIQAKSSDR